MGVKVPEDRSLKQPVRGFCRNPECRDQENKEFQFTVEHDNFACPKCKANQQPMIGVLVLTHLLVPQDKGPITGSGGRQFAIACDTKRAYLATASNLEAVSDNPVVTNCQTCLELAGKLKIVKPLGQKLIVEDDPKP